MTTDDQTADDAIQLRQAYISGGGAADDDPDMEVARRVGRMLDFKDDYPALDELAEHRLTALARLAVKGVRPDPRCTVHAAAVVLDAVPDPAPVGHRYAVNRVTTGRRIGTAWLSTEPDTRGLYEAVRHGIRGSVRGSTLFEAVERLALLIDAEDRTRHDARRGAVQ